MNRRSLALGAVIALPAGLAAFHADAGTSPASAPSRHRPCQPDADKGIRDVHCAYFIAREDVKKVEVEPEAPFGSEINDRQEADLTDAVHRCCDALEDASPLAAETILGLQLKSAMLADALVIAGKGGFELDGESREFRLAASLCADLARLIQGGQA
jgi:hypothetical protein